MESTIKTEKIGKLGFGYMRLPRINDEFDYAQIIKMADAFLSSGGTYFDAAYVYEGAEVALRKSVVERHPRENFQVASKLPVGMVNKDRPLNHFLETSLERLGTDYIDFYLLHGIDAKGSILSEELGAWEYLGELKAKGIIRHMGLSFHGNPEDLGEILTKHPETEFVQLQINYFDWDRPDFLAHRLHEITLEHKTPIVVMEPLLGGKLASTNSPIAELFSKANPGASIASWAFRYVAQLENVFVTLSGMSNYEQMIDNIDIYANLKALSADEMGLIEKAVDILRNAPRIECTSCNYCKECPAKIRIPDFIDLFNDQLMHKTITNLDGHYKWLTNDSGKARDCTSCGACEKICPQNLKIIDTIAEISNLFD